MNFRTNPVLLLMIFAFATRCSLSDSYHGAGQGAASRASALWGTHGELWIPTSRLPDYSYAGYHSGNQKIPEVAVVANVKDFGATGDGSADDTAAFQSALASVTAGAILIPRGRYRIARPIAIRKSGVVLRGEDRDETVILAGHVPGDCSKANQGRPNCAPYQGVGMLQIIGNMRGSKLSEIVASAKRGERTVQVSSAAALRAGQVVRFRMKNPPDNSLGCHLYADVGCLNAERKRWFNGNIVDWAVEIESVNGNSVSFVRPLRIDVRATWSPEIWSFIPSVRESGFENLTIQFSGEPYAGHNKEQGYYAVYINAYDSWVRNLTIIDADRGIEVNGGYNTITGVTLLAVARNPIFTGNIYATGHYGFSVAHPSGQDNLFVDSRIETIFVHNLSVNSFANGNVYSRITSSVPYFDHHGGAPYENLFTEITLTRNAENFFKSGGNRADEPNGTRTTVWNVTYRGLLSRGKSEDRLPGFNLIGVDGFSEVKPSQTSARWWVEPWMGSDTTPPNLYDAQLGKRKGRQD
jgi:Pectate lyase superfamily protein